MYDIIDHDDFKLFFASQHAREMCDPMIRAAVRANAEFLKMLEPVPPAMPITGAFIYAHAPNYVGNPTLTWGVPEWRDLFRQFRELGLDTAIFQAAIWKELEECYYPSQAFAAYKTWNVIEPMLEAAGEEKIRIFLGGYGSTTGLSEQENARTTMAREEKACIDCLTEMMKYRDSFDGFYFSSETAFMGTYNPGKIGRLNKVYRTFFEHIKATDDSLSIMMSPGTKYFPGKEQEMTDSWLETLDGVPLDILAPQDSIGTCGSQLQYAEAMYRVWDAVRKERRITFWSNIEIFQREDLTQLNNSITPDPERVIAQINLADSVAEKLICWEAPYYLCDPENSRATALAQAVFLNRPKKKNPPIVQESMF